jgi:hypothetical protein
MRPVKALGIVCPLILLTIFSVHEFRTHRLKSTSSVSHYAAPAPGEPDAIARFGKNLTKPTVKALLPNGVVDGSSSLIAVFTDAQYCGIANGGARVLAQLTKGPSAVAPSNLLISDCSGSLDVVSKAHQSDDGFSGVLEITLTWNTWSLSATATGFSPVSAATFSSSDQAIISGFTNSFRTDKVALVSGADVNEMVGLSFGFALDSVTVGLYKNPTFVATDWFEQAPASADSGYLTNNMELAISHSLIQTIVSQHNSALAFTTAFNGTSATFDNFTEATIPQGGNSVTGIQLASSVSSPSFGSCKIALTTGWTGSPLVFTTANASGDQPICQGLAQLIQNQVVQNLQNTKLIVGTSREFTITLHNQPASMHFTGSFSNTDAVYLSFFGNGSLDVN